MTSSPSWRTSGPSPRSMAVSIRSIGLTLLSPRPHTYVHMSRSMWCVCIICFLASYLQVDVDIGVYSMPSRTLVMAAANQFGEEALVVKLAEGTYALRLDFWLWSSVPPCLGFSMQTAVKQIGRAHV